MKASELIAQLQELIEEHGDHDVLDLGLDDIEEVEFDQSVEAFILF